MCGPLKSVLMTASLTIFWYGSSSELKSENSSKRSSLSALALLTVEVTSSCGMFSDMVRWSSSLSSTKMAHRFHWRDRGNVYDVIGRRTASLLDGNPPFWPPTSPRWPRFAGRRCCLSSTTSSSSSLLSVMCTTTIDYRNDLLCAEWEVILLTAARCNDTSPVEVPFILVMSLLLWWSSLLRC